MPIQTVRITQVYRAVSRLSNQPSFSPSHALTQPRVGLNMDLKIMAAADMEMDMGRANMVSYTGLSRRFFMASRPSKMVRNRVTGTLMAVSSSVLAKNCRKSRRRKTERKLSSPTNRSNSPLSLTAYRLFSRFRQKG